MKIWLQGWLSEIGYQEATLKSALQSFESWSTIELMHVDSMC